MYKKLKELLDRIATATPNEIPRLRKEIKESDLPGAWMIAALSCLQDRHDEVLGSRGLR